MIPVYLFLGFLEAGKTAFVQETLEDPEFNTGEKTLLVVPYRETEFGTFYTFEPLTLCPIDTRPIVRSMLTAEETEWLNAYHRMVYDRLSPLLDEEHRAWLESKTKQLTMDN